MSILEEPWPSHPQKLAVSRHAMIATAHEGATRAGVHALERGGNAIDAAVAAAFALGVCEPAASGLGGQTMMLLHRAQPRRTIALDGSSRAPNRATPGLLQRAELLRGYRATTVPSTVATLGYALSTYGRLSLAQVLEPAIALAMEGYPVSALQRNLTKRELPNLQPRTAGALFLKQGQSAHPVGTIFRQPILARTLERLAKAGWEDFYQGEIARTIARDMEANDGLLHQDDLAYIPRPIERRPLSGKYEGMRVLTFPPPAAGRTLLEMLNIHQQLPEKLRDFETPIGAHALVEVIRRAFLDRQDRPFDPAFFPQVQDSHRLTADYARLASRQIRKRVVPTHGETTHLSVMDGEGNAVALTQSIERVYGACVATPELGFLYNNYLAAFEYEDVSHPYFLRPNAVPWASVAPTFVFRGTRPWLAIGSPGSERIAPSVLQVLTRLVWQEPLDAVTAPRLHCSLDGKVSLEASRMRDDVVPYLARRGYTIDEREPFSFYLGCVQLVLRGQHGFQGVADPRRDGSARGPAKPATSSSGPSSTSSDGALDDSFD